MNKNILNTSTQNISIYIMIKGQRKLKAILFPRVCLSLFFFGGGGGNLFSVSCIYVLPVGQCYISNG